MEYKPVRVIISGGGTGGHIFPAISIASRFKEVNPESEILFVGAEGRMEMEKVPAAGFRIVGLKVAGLQRKRSLKNIVENLKLPLRFARSIRKARHIIKEFKPDIAIGVGGYASAPLLFAATEMKIPTLIQEQNGFAGLTNKMLGRRVDRICVAYEGMEKFFPADKIVLTGNPIRKLIVPCTPQMKAEGIEFYGMDPDKKHLLIVGGSLGSGTLNNAMKKWISDGCPGGEDVEVLWQCGKYYKESIDAFMESHKEDCPQIHYSEFISRMALAYAMADVVISRSGASSISELCAARKAAVLVPSPNVAEDHQTHNAMALVRKGAGILVKDAEAVEKLMGVALKLLDDPEKIQEMETNIAKLAKMDAGAVIVDEAYRLI